MCPYGTHDITPTTLWRWAPYTAPRNGNTPNTSWEGRKCRYGHLHILQGRTVSLRPYGGPCQNLTQGIDIKTRGYQRRRGGLSTRESLHEGGREYTWGFGDWAAPYEQAFRRIGNGGWRPRDRWLLLPLHHLCSFLACYGVIESFWCFNGRFTYYLNHLAPLCVGP